LVGGAIGKGLYVCFSFSSFPVYPHTNTAGALTWHARFGRPRGRRGLIVLDNDTDKQGKRKLQMKV